MLAGIATGIFAGLLFGFRYEFFPGTVPILVGASIGAIVLVLGATYFEPGRSWQKIMWSLASSVIVTVLITSFGIFLMLILNLETLFTDWTMTDADMARASVTVGGTIGLILGCQVQLALYLITASKTG
jgi:hypothetical protein